MEIVERAESFVLGTGVEARFDELATAVPAAWQEVFARRDELPAPSAGGFAETSRHLGDGRYRETVGVLLDAPLAVPGGMVVTPAPAGRYVHHRHDGAVEEIAAGFQEIYDWAATRDLRLGDVKLDVGYTADGIPQPHDLYIVVA
ncbi:GyrI-like domain-containing protein [Blastococcus sp. SYSU DS1024]